MQQPRYVSYTKENDKIGVACGNLDTRRIVVLLWDVALVQRSV
jgi:hypothetical protein